jgi:hypothetical protein
MEQQHTHGPDDIPEGLCRRCHPELNRTGAQRAALIREEQQAQSAEVAKSALLRQLGKATQALAQAERKVARGGGSQGIGIKQAKAARRTINRLEAELAGLSNG